MPFTALLEDMINRCQKLGLRTYQWSDKAQARGSFGTAEIVVAGTWACTNDVFRTWVKMVSLDGWLDRIVIDEDHLLYTQAKFRAEMNELYWLRDCGCPLVLLTATLPPLEQPLLESKLKIEKDSGLIEYFRLPTTRQNIHYSVIPFRNTNDCLQAVLDDINREWETMQDPAAWAIVYCRSIDDAERVGRQLKCGVYNSRLKGPAAKKEVFSNWANGGPGIRKFISATSGLGVGIDIPSVRIVYHYRESQDFLGFVQESGRAGRDGLPAKSKVFLDTTSLTRLEKQEHAPSLGERAIFDYHIKGFCRQGAISFYVDGTSTRCVNSKDSELIPCDLCQMLNSQAKMVSRPSISNSPRGNSSPTMHCRTNQSALLHGQSGSINSQTPHHPVRDSTHRGRSYPRIFDAPLAGLPHNATGFQIPSHKRSHPALNTTILASDSKPRAGQQNSQNDRIYSEAIDDGYLSSVHSSDAWLSPLVVDKERLTQPQPINRPNADNRISPHF